MASKIKKVITYLGTASNIPQPVANLVPNFENSGVRYQGWYKVDKGGGNYELRQQTTRFYSLKVQNSGSTTNTFSRSNTTNNFFATTIGIDFKTASNPIMVTIYDGAASNPRLRVYLDNEKGHFSLDLSSCPRKFSGTTIILTTDSLMSSTEWININLFGWDEE
jgi:hypothetical protein